MLLDNPQMWLWSQPILPLAAPPTCGLWRFGSLIFIHRAPAPRSPRVHHEFTLVKVLIPILIIELHQSSIP